MGLEHCDVMAFIIRTVMIVLKYSRVMKHQSQWNTGLEINH